MGIKKNKLAAKMVEFGITMEVLAAELGINRCTLFRRLRTLNLSLKDIYKIADVLNLTPEETAEIFLSKQCQ